MKIVKLNQSNIDGVRLLFDETQHEIFVKTYLSDLQNYHSYGAINDDGFIESRIEFYESIDDASWYLLNTAGLSHVVINVLDKVIDHNEKKGRLKFYGLFNGRNQNIPLSNFNNERYDYFDEFFVTEKHQCQFTLPWQILYNRTLISSTTYLKCFFLKQEYRSNLYDAGRL